MAACARKFGAEAHVLHVHAVREQVENGQLRRLLKDVMGKLEARACGPAARCAWSTAATPRRRPSQRLRSAPRRTWWPSALGVSAVGVVQAIAETSEREGADLVVLGSRRPSDLNGLLLGSVAHGLIHRLGKPVLWLGACASARRSAEEAARLSVDLRVEEIIVKPYDLVLKTLLDDFDRWLPSLAGDAGNRLQTDLGVQVGEGSRGTASGGQGAAAYDLSRPMRDRHRHESGRDVSALPRAQRGVQLVAAGPQASRLSFRARYEPPGGPRDRDLRG